MNSGVVREGVPYVRLNEEVWAVVEPSLREKARDSRVFFVGAKDFTLTEVLDDRLRQRSRHSTGADATSRRLPCLALHVVLNHLPCTQQYLGM